MEGGSVGVTVAGPRFVARLRAGGAEAYGEDTREEILSSRRSRHRVKKFHVGLGLGQAAQQKFHRFDRGERAEYLAQNPDAAQLVGWKEQFVFTCAGALDIDSRENALVGEAAVQVDFHVAGALELFKDDVVHAAAGVDQRGGDDGERAAFFNVTGCGKETPRALQGVGVNTAGEHFAGWRSDRVVSARQASDRVEKNNHVAFVFDEAFGFFQNHLGDLNVALRRLVKGRADDFAFHGAGHVGDFFRALVDQQHNQGDFRMIHGDGIGDGLQHHGLAGARRGDDQSALPFADRAEQIQHATGQVVLGGFHLEAALRIEGREVIEENFIARDFGVLEINGLHLDQCEVAFAVLGWTDLPGNGVSGAQVEFPDLRGRDVDVIRSGKVVVLRRAEKAEAIRKAFQYAFGEDQPALFGLGAQDLKNQFLLAHTAGASNV